MRASLVGWGVKWVVGRRKEVRGSKYKLGESDKDNSNKSDKDNDDDEEHCRFCVPLA